MSEVTPQQRSSRRQSNRQSSRNVEIPDFNKLNLNDQSALINDIQDNSFLNDEMKNLNEVYLEKLDKKE